MLAKYSYWARLWDFDPLFIKRYRLEFRKLSIDAERRKRRHGLGYGKRDYDAKPALLQSGQSGDTLAARSPALEAIMTMSPFAVTAYINQY
jgi:hypothetical protein